MATEAKLMHLKPISLMHIEADIRATQLTLAKGRALGFQSGDETDEGNFMDAEERRLAMLLEQREHATADRLR
jgi:hypothetical protein